MAKQYLSVRDKVRAFMWCYMYQLAMPGILCWKLVNSVLYDLLADNLTACLETKISIL